jgi:hypothetical protein
VGKPTATDEYPTEQQGISNFQVNVNSNVSGGKSFGTLDIVAGDIAYVNVSGKNIKPFPFPFAVNLNIGHSLVFGWIFAVRRSPYMPLLTMCITENPPG